jgi:hypothetical protein
VGVVAVSVSECREVKWQQLGVGGEEESGNKRDQGRVL